ncbi:MAG TPA: hypothetical protein VGJ63_04480, partial [Micromonosporaceae bacterium]
MAGRAAPGRPSQSPSVISPPPPLESVAFAARHPDRVGRLVLYGGYANGRRIASAGVAAAMVDLVRAHWGLG